MADANDLIMGSSIPSCSFAAVETVYEGTITALDTMHARKFGTQEPDFWKDGQPKMQAVITLKTELADASIENDNGMRRLYVSSKGMKDAIASAVKKTGAVGLGVGGTLGIKYLRDGEGKNAANPPKVYGAKYVPPPAGSEYEEPEGESYDEYSEEPF